MSTESTETSEEISTASNYYNEVPEVVAIFFRILLGFSLILIFMTGISFAYMLNCNYNEIQTKARIIKENRLVVAEIVQITDGHWETNNNRHNAWIWISPAMQLSYDYEHENYLVWKNNIDKHTLSQRSTHCNVYVDPSNPNKYVLQESSYKYCSYIFWVCFFLFSIAGGGVIYFFVLLSAKEEGVVSMKVGLVLFGCAAFIPVIVLICIGCCKSMFQQGYNSILFVKETTGIEFKNIPSQNCIEATTVTEIL